MTEEKYKEIPSQNIIITNVGQCKKRPNERIALTCVRQIMDDGQISQEGVMAKKRGICWA
jgi:hypothetical protein